MKPETYSLQTAQTSRRSRVKRSLTTVLLGAALSLLAPALAEAAPPAPAESVAAEGYTSFGTVDWDRDGFRDVVTREDTNGNLWLYPGKGGRGPNWDARILIGTGWTAYTPFGLTDWDRDGFQDVLTREDTNGNLWLYPGKGGRGPNWDARILIGTGWTAYTPFGLTDWDRDGFQDVLTREDTNGNLWLYPGKGGRGPNWDARILIGTGWTAYTPFGLTDWDRDGFQDVLTRENTNGNLWLYPGKGGRGPNWDARILIGTGWTAYTPFGLTDWDRDGFQDVLTREDTSRILWLYPGKGGRGPNWDPRVLIGTGW